MTIEKLLTDNGSPFTDRFTSKTKEPTGKHAFDRKFALFGIEHRPIKPRHAQTHGMVERFNGRISDILVTTRFRSRENLQTTIERDAALYNDHLPQKALGHKTPLLAICTWREHKPERFVRRLKNQAGLETCPPGRWRLEQVALRDRRAEVLRLPGKRGVPGGNPRQSVQR